MKKAIMMLLFGVFLVGVVEAKAPSFTLGGFLGGFTISTENFDKIYESPTGFSYGFESMIKFKEFDDGNILYGVIQGQNFSKEGTPLTYGTYSSSTGFKVEWKETIVDLGFRYIFKSNEKIGNTLYKRYWYWLGGGLSHIEIEEKISSSSSSASATASLDGTGTYLEGGGSFDLYENVDLFLNLKYDIVSIKSAITSTSIDVGGLTYVVGLRYIFGTN